jgi:hypothetical protein
MSEPRPETNAILYAHDEIYGQVTVTQGSPYIGNAVTHPKYMLSRANFLKVAQISAKSGFERRTDPIHNSACLDPDRSG